MRKTLGLLLCFCMLIVLLPVLGVSAVSPESDFLFDSSTGTITSYTGLGGDVEIPPTIGGTAVTSIGDYAFYNCTGLTGLIIPDSVLSVGEGAFFNCSGMTGISLPGSILSIGNYAFYSCSSLTGITIPKNVASVGENAFYGCGSLTGITFYSSSTVIFDSINTIPPAAKITGYDLSTAQDYAVKYGRTFKYLVSPESYFNFDPSTGTITGYTGPDGEVVIPPSIGDIAVAAIGDGAFGYCGGLTDIVLPAGLTHIGNAAFADCSGLTDITIPGGVVFIGYGAFERCSGLTSINVLPGNTVYKSDNNCLIEISSLKLIAGCNTSVIPDYITSIGDSAFNDCKGLTGVSIPGSVTSIGSEAFSGCSGLTGIIIPDGIASIESYVFYRCSGLTSVTIPGSVVSIGTEAFRSCSSLTDLIIPQSVVSIGNSAFTGTSSLTVITVQSGNTVYKSDNNCLIETAADKLILGCKTSVIPGYITSIGDGAFAYNSGLTGITIPGSVVSIGEGAFSDCTGLTGITIPGSIISIESGVFYGCSALTGITIPGSITSIGTYAFAGCASLTDVTVPDNVAFIGAGAFAYCSGLTGITLSGSITSVEDSMFRNCYSLTDVTVPGSVTSIGNYAFSNCYGLKSITIPAGVASIANNAFNYCPGDLIIYGAAGSFAETYAADHGYSFIAVNNTPAITSLPAAGAITYGQTLADSLLTGGSASVAGAFAWTDGSTAPAVSDSGTTKYGITFVPEDTVSYGNATAEISLIIQKAIPAVILEDLSAVYNGNIIKINNAKVMLVNGEVYGGPVLYTYYVDRSCMMLTQRIHGAAFPGGAPVNPGVYYVRARIAESGNYTSAVSDTARLTISLFRPVIYYRITASAGTGGYITPSDMSVRQHSLKTFFIVPNIGYEIADVKVDGVSAGKVWYYVFADVTGDHTIHAEFKPVK